MKKSELKKMIREELLREVGGYEDWLGYTPKGFDYGKQAAEIKKLALSISKKAEKFAKTKQKSPWFEELLSVHNQLEEIDDWFKG